MGEQDMDKPEQGLSHGKRITTVERRFIDDAAVAPGPRQLS